MLVARMRVQGVPVFALNHVTTILENPPIETQTIGDLGFSALAYRSDQLRA